MFVVANARRHGVDLHGIPVGAHPFAASFVDSARDSSARRLPLEPGYAKAAMLGNQLYILQSEVRPIHPIRMEEEVKQKLARCHLL